MTGIRRQVHHKHAMQHTEKETKEAHASTDEDSSPTSAAIPRREAVQSEATGAASKRRKKACTRAAAQAKREDRADTERVSSLDALLDSSQPSPHILSTEAAENVFRRQLHKLADYCGQPQAARPPGRPAAACRLRPPPGLHARPAWPAPGPPEASPPGRAILWVVSSAVFLRRITPPRGPYNTSGVAV